MTAVMSIDSLADYKLRLELEWRRREEERVARERAMSIAIAPEAKRAYDVPLRDAVQIAHPNYLWADHLERLASVLERVAQHELLRVMIWMPPRHGKSEIVSRLFSAHYLRMYPDRDVALTTYGAELSYDLSRDARANFAALGGEIASDSAAVKSWHTSDGGNFWATGVGGPATGRGFHLGIIDDPYKDAQEAASATVRRSRINWYRSVFRTRAAPGAAIILLQTRWHMDDLSGGLLREEAVSRAGWHLVDMPAERRRPMIAVPATSALDGVIGAKAQELPPTVTVEPDARDDARWLWTKRFPAGEYEQTKRELGGESGYFWNALYQQRPVASEGGMFKREWFKAIPRSQLPPLVSEVRWWDLAASEGEGAFTAGLRLGKDNAGNFYITGLEHEQLHPGARDTLIVQTARLDGPRVKVLFPQDPGAAGKEVAQKFVRLLSGIAPVAIRRETGDKELRATLPASDAANGLFHIVAEPWAAAVLQELADFGPGADYRDIVDALSGAHAFLAEPQRTVRLVSAD